jgi:hypothetical protein
VVTIHWSVLSPVLAAIRSRPVASLKGSSGMSHSKDR